jgi:hypothetical protein
MRATEFLIERWTKKTVADYYDHKKDLDFNNKDVKVSKPFDGCVLLRYQSVPDVARSFFRVAEYYDGKHYGGKARQVSLTDFLDNWMDRQGNVDYFKFWDGFNIPDHAFRSWLKSAKPLSKAEQVMVDAVRKNTQGLKKFCVLGVGSDDPATMRHEMFHARYYLDTGFKTAVDDLIKLHAKDRDFKTIRRVLTKKLDYVDHVDEEAAAYLYAGSQLKLVFGVEAKDLVRAFRDLDTK